MAISVTTRSGKGAPLTNTEMDTNLTSLARSATTTQEGNVELATSTEAIAGLDDTRAVTSAGVASVLSTTFSDYTFSTTKGHYTLPGGFVIQWGLHNMAGGSDTQSITYEQPFDTATLNISLTNIEDFSNEGNVVRVTTYDENGFTLSNAGGNTFTGYFWIALGY